MAGRKKRAAQVALKLKELFPNARIVLKYKTNWELLVAVILSAQCTDKKVNEVSEKLFKKYRTLDDYVKVDKKELSRILNQPGFIETRQRISWLQQRW